MKCYILHQTIVGVSSGILAGLSEYKNKENKKG